MEEDLSGFTAFAAGGRSEIVKAFLRGDRVSKLMIGQTHLLGIPKIFRFSRLSQ